jgi:hypothetical protein
MRLKVALLIRRGQYTIDFLDGYQGYLYVDRYKAYESTQRH